MARVDAIRLTEEIVRRWRTGQGPLTGRKRFRIVKAAALRTLDRVLSTETAATRAFTGLANCAGSPPGSGRRARTVARSLRHRLRNALYAGQSAKTVALVATDPPHCGA